MLTDKTRTFDISIKDYEIDDCNFNAELQIEYCNAFCAPFLENRCVVEFPVEYDDTCSFLNKEEVGTILVTLESELSDPAELQEIL